eukprot:TRINITY_DN9729_c0_g1_i2.p1 TRINITY_DN9729_c0_g1~~TRINITY_DN9729_c0_g1_i2.p1  ORF type:complete len:152 (-),score=46.39 TRINITY_DN9729_c0_g1_i2:81-536(-)
MLAEVDLPPEKIEECRQAFALFDKDGNGNITVDELETVLRSFGQTPTPDELHNMMKEVDIDGNGEIDFNEFLKMLARNITSSEDEIAECFKVFDKNSSGAIEPDELREVMESIGEVLTAEEVQLMIQELDDNNNGSVCFVEFQKMAEGKKM